MTAQTNKQIGTYNMKISRKQFKTTKGRIRRLNSHCWLDQRSNHICGVKYNRILINQVSFL